MKVICFHSVVFFLVMDFRTSDVDRRAYFQLGNTSMGYLVQLDKLPVTCRAIAESHGEDIAILILCNDVQYPSAETIIVEYILDIRLRDMKAKVTKNISFLANIFRYFHYRVFHSRGGYGGVVGSLVTFLLCLYNSNELVDAE